MGKVMYMRKGEFHKAPLTGILANEIAVGSSVYLNENGTPAEYLVVHKGLPSSMYDESCNGLWLLRKDCYENKQWHSSNVNSYKDSTIHSHLNSDFLNVFDTKTQRAIKQAKIPYVNGTGSGGSVASGANGLRTKIFLLGGYEIGWNQGNNGSIPIDGSKLDYFSSGTATAANKLRTAYLNGSGAIWWTRSPSASTTNKTFIVALSGGIATDDPADLSSVRPAMILPTNAVFDKDTLVLKGIA